jgi:tricorn protease
LEFDLSSPLSGPGINIKTGDYLLAVNGVPFNTENLYSYFAKTAGRQIALSVNNYSKGRKEFTVVPVSSEEFKTTRLG